MGPSRAGTCSAVGRTTLTELQADKRFENWRKRPFCKEFLVGGEVWDKGEEVVADCKDSDRMMDTPRVTCGVDGGRKEKLTCSLDSVACCSVVWNSSAFKPPTPAEAEVAHAQPLAWSGSSFQVLMQDLFFCGNTHTSV